MAKMMFKTSATRELILRRGSVQRFIDSRCKFEDSKEIWDFFFENPLIALAVARNYDLSNAQKVRKFIDKIAEPKLHVIFAGSKGSGKTALAFWIAEEVHKKDNRRCCLLYPLKFNPDLLPWYFYPADDENNIGHDSFVIFDEAQITMNSRRAMSKTNVDFGKFLTIQRHKNISMLVIQQDIAMSDVNQFRLADNFIFKKAGTIQLEEHDRGNSLNKFLKFLRPLSKKETLLISSDLNDIILFENPVASFWNETLSTMAVNLEIKK
jgi:DNA polymerase III delta prime subunit